MFLIKRSPHRKDSIRAALPWEINLTGVGHPLEPDWGLTTLSFEYSVFRSASRQAFSQAPIPNNRGVLLHRLTKNSCELGSFSESLHGRSTGQAHRNRLESGLGLITLGFKSSIFLWFPWF